MRLTVLLIMILAALAMGQEKRARLDRLEVKKELQIKGKDRTGFFTALNDSDQITQPQVQDSIISLKKMTPAAVNYIGSGGSVTNNPDDKTLENKSGSTIGVKDGFATVADTTFLKGDGASTVGSMRFLRQLSSANSQGGGYFVLMDSTYKEGVVAFNSATAGKQWVRVDFINNPKVVNAAWSGFGVNGTATSNSAAMDLVRGIAKSVGGTIYIPAGTYLIQHRIIINWDGGGIEGVSRDKTILKRSPTFDTGWSWSTGGGYSIVNFTNMHGGFIRNITIDADFKISSGDTGTGNPILADHCYDLQITDNRVMHITGHTYCIWALGSSRVWILRNDVSGDSLDTYAAGNTNAHEGIEVSQESIRDVWVEDNYVHGLSSNGIYVYFGISGSVSDGGEYVENVRVADNTVRNITNVGILGMLDYVTLDSLNTRGFKDFAVEHNTIVNCGWGIKLANNRVADMGYSFYDPKIVDNTIRSCDLSIKLWSLKDIEVINNKIISDSSTSSPVQMYDIWYAAFRHNRFINGNGYGFYITNTTRFIEFDHNIIRGSKNGGLVVYSDYYPSVTNNLIIDCNTGGGTTNYQDHSGIGISGANTIELDKNRIIDTRSTPLHQYGIYTLTDLDSSQIGYNYVNTAARYKAGSSGINVLRLNNNGTFRFWGYITPTASSTSTRVYCRLPSSSNEHIFVVQTSGTSINPTVSSTNYYDGFKINHSAAAGTEKIFYMVMPR